jgi:hypothetical protein
MNWRAGFLYASSNAGRYEVNVDGVDLTTGMVCEVWLAGIWVSATVCHSRGRPDGSGKMAVERPKGVSDGYYLLVEDAEGRCSLCGLCTGMYVRIPL